VDVHCPTDQWQEGETIVKQPRLFRNHPGSRFSGRLHEQLGPPPGYEPRALAPQDAFTIKHWGYIPNLATGDRRSERNRRILELEIAEHPDEHFSHYNLGLQYAGEKEFALGLRSLQRAMELWKSDPGPRDGHVASMFAMAVLCAVESQQHETALQIEAATPEKYVSTDLLYHAGVACWSLGSTPEALKRFERARAEVALRGHNAHDSSTATWRPLIMQAAIHSERGEHALARQRALAALTLAPTRPDALYLAAHAAYSVGRIDEARDLCRRALAGDRDEGFKPKLRRLLLNIANDSEDDALAAESLAGELEGLAEGDVLFLRARLEGRRGNVHRQQELLIEGCSRYPENHDIRLALSEALQGQGFEAQALELLAGAMDYVGVPPAVYQQLARLLARQGRLEDAANALELAGRAAAAAELVA
jgi:tetratricopeptide (TPR) repeat protein